MAKKRLITIKARSGKKRNRRCIPNVDSESLVITSPIYQKVEKGVWVPFDKIFHSSQKNLNKFNIGRSAYNKNIDNTCRYANVFLQNYDPDKEFLTGLLSIKFNIDELADGEEENDYYLKNFISDILEYLMTDSIIKKIYAMVNDYYCIDLDPKEAAHADSHVLQFQNDHGKTLMALAIAYKLTIPVVCHYHAMKNQQMARLAIAEGKEEPKLKAYIYNIFASFIPLFQGDSDMFVKLTMIANSHLTVTRGSEKLMWSRAVNKKTTPTTYLKKLIELLVVDIIPKAVFNKSIVNLIQVAVPTQIKTMLTGKDPYEYCDISIVSKTDELSGLEKMEANSAKVSDLDIIIGNLGIRDGIKNIKKTYKVKYTKDEIKYYKSHLTSYKFSEMILQYFAKFFDGVGDLKNMKKKDYIKLLILFKKVMAKLGFVYINQIMTGNLDDTVKRRKISSKQLKKYEESPQFKKVMKKYSMAMGDDTSDTIRVIAMLINTPVEYVDYSHQDMYGKSIVADPDIVADEYLRFVQML